MKAIKRKTPIALIAVGFLQLSCLSVFAADVTLKMAHFAAEEHPGHIAALQFAERVKERTQGAVEITIFPKNMSGAPPEVLEQTQQGIIDMNLPTQGTLGNIEKAFATVMTPFAFNNYEKAHAVLDGPFQEWAAPKLEAHNLIMLSNWEYGFRNITNSKHPINTPEDVAGLSIRTPPEIQLVAAMEALGASAKEISFSELPEILNQGLIDGQENPINTIYTFNLYKYQRYLALTKHSYNSMVHIINKASWEKLSPEQQDIIREESKAAGELMRKLVQEQEQKDLQSLKDAGMEVTEPDLNLFKAKMEPAYGRIAEFAGKENMDKFLSFFD